MKVGFSRQDETLRANPQISDQRGSLSFNGLGIFLIPHFFLLFFQPYVFYFLGITLCVCFFLFLSLVFVLFLSFNPLSFTYQTLLFFLYFSHSLIISHISFTILFLFHLPSTPSLILPLLISHFVLSLLS